MFPCGLICNDQQRRTGSVAFASELEAAIHKNREDCLYDGVYQLLADAVWEDCDGGEMMAEGMSSANQLFQRGWTAKDGERRGGRQWSDVCWMWKLLQCLMLRRKDFLDRNMMKEDDNLEWRMEKWSRNGLLAPALTASATKTTVCHQHVREYTQ